MSGEYHTRYNATETCSCGATFTVDAYTQSELAARLTEFRAQHQHFDFKQRVGEYEVSGSGYSRDPNAPQGFILQDGAEITWSTSYEITEDGIVREITEEE